MIDSHGRTIDYMRISITDRCNFRCIYCMPAEGVVPLSHNDILSFDEILHIVRVAADMGIRRVRLTGGEPLVRKGVVNLAQQLNDIPGIEDISLTTNGVLLPRMARDLREAGVRRVNISLDTLDAEQFRLVTRVGCLDDTLAGIDAALEAGFEPVKVNAVTVRSLNQDFLEFAKLSVDRPLHVRFIEYMPVGDATDATDVTEEANGGQAGGASTLDELPESDSCVTCKNNLTCASGTSASGGSFGSGWGKADVISSEEVREIVSEQGMHAGLGALVPADASRPEGAGPAEYYKFETALGTVGFISPLSRHFCGSCNRLRLSADGRIMPCLFSDDYFDIKQAAASDSDDAVREVLNLAIGNKPDEHHDRVGTERGMSQIGG